MSEDIDRAMRASDADRVEVADRLRVALDDGRLDVHEYDRRLRDAYAAATYAELDRVTADLPAPAGPSRAELAERAEMQTRQQAEDRAAWYGEWRSWLGGALIMSTIWALTSLPDGELEFFWPVIPLGIWAAVLVAHAIFGDDCPGGTPKG